LLVLAKAVSNIAVGQDVDGIGRIIPEFLSNLANQDPKIFAVRCIAGTAQGPLELRVGDWATGPLHQEAQRVKFSRRKPYLFASALNTVAHRIEHDVSNRYWHL